uniref:ORF55 n=1 Tax=Latid herpesvirus 1 TaxID=3096545 RepID=A0AB33V6I2_9VIRU
MRIQPIPAADTMSFVPSLSAPVSFFVPLVARRSSGAQGEYSVCEATLPIPRQFRTGGVLMVEKVTVDLTETTYGPRTQGVFTLTDPLDDSAHLVPPTVRTTVALPAENHQLYPYSEESGDLNWAAGILGVEVDHKLCDQTNIRKTVMSCLGVDTDIERPLVKRIEESVTALKAGDADAVSRHALKCLGCNQLGEMRLEETGGELCLRMPLHPPGLNCPLKGPSNLFVVQLRDGVVEHPLKYVAAFLRGLAAEMPGPIHGVALELQQEILGRLVKTSQNFKCTEVSSFPMSVRFYESQRTETLIPLKLLDRLLDYKLLMTAMGGTLIDPLVTESMKLHVFSTARRVSSASDLNFSASVKISFRQFPTRSPQRLIKCLQNHPGYDADVHANGSLKNLSFENIMRLCDLK